MRERFFSCIHGVPADTDCELCDDLDNQWDDPLGPDSYQRIANERYADLYSEDD